MESDGSFFVWSEDNDNDNEEHLDRHGIRDTEAGEIPRLQHGQNNHGMGLMRKNKRAKDEKYNPREWDESKSVHVKPEPRIKSGISTSIRLPEEMVSKLRKIAKRKGDIGYQTLLKIWIAERLEQESA